MPVTGHNAALTPTCLAVADVVAVLRSVGSRHISEEAVKADIAAGAPTNPDGTINLPMYVAWLAREAEHARA